MSSILKGADKAYLREYNESEDERRLDALQDSIGSIRKATKGGKYLGSDVLDIMLEVQGFAEKLGIDPDELAYAENQVREAQNNLESAIYGLEEPFEDAIRTLQNRIDDAGIDENISGNKPASIDSEMDAYFGSKPGELEEESNDFDDTFNSVFKDRKDKGSMEKPRPRPLPKPEETNEESKGLWANIHAKRKRGEKPAKKGDKAYPKTLDIDEEKQRLDPKCWDGYKKQGTKMKGDKRVNNCVPVKESNILKGLNESQLDEGAKEKLIALGLAGALGLGALMPSAEDSPLGKELQAAAQAGDAVAAYHLNNLDLYTDEGMARTLVNLKIAYIDDSPREDVKAFLSDPKRFPALARK
tara:strand:+ start:176 stop:1246 length:1071 start_codon:yes stop_codon:yes gene_type:complete